MTLIVAIDPGKDHVGFAAFLNKELIVYEYVQSTSQYDLHECVGKVFAGVTSKKHKTADILCVENQQIYGKFAKGDPNDLLPLSFVAGAIKATIPHKMFMHPKPKEWKGSIKKEMFTRRIIQRIAEDFPTAFNDLNRYTNASKVVDVLDAIGLGYYAMGISLV